MIADCIQRNIPTLDRVTTLAIGAKLAAVNVSVTISTTGTGVFEDEACVALGATHLLMHSTQGIIRLVVVELRLGTDRRPTCVGMAVFARHSQGAMRIGHLGLRTAYSRARTF